MRTFLLVLLIGSFTLALRSQDKKNVVPYTPSHGTGLGMVPVTGGFSVPNDTKDEGEPPVAKTSEAFLIGKTEVAYDTWKMVYDWATDNARGVGKYTFANPGAEGSRGKQGATPTKNKRQPVTQINWRDAMVWTNALTEYYNATQSTNLTLVYYADIDYTIPIRTSTNRMDVYDGKGEEDNPYIKPGATGFRLSGSFEWEIAASYIDGKAWTPANFASGAIALTDTASRAVAWYGINADEGTRDVGVNRVNFKNNRYQLHGANALGIYDMSGNVWELCFDWYCYPHNPRCSASRIIRGGGFNNTMDDMSVGRVAKASPFYKADNIGFRVAKKQ